MPHLQLAYPRPDIAVITLNRPEKLNALSYDLVEDLHTTLEEIGEQQRMPRGGTDGGGPRLLLGP